MAVTRSPLFFSILLSLGACGDAARERAADAGPPPSSAASDGSTSVVDGGSLVGLDEASTEEPARTLTIALSDPELVVDGTPATLIVTALLDGKPISGVGYAVDDVRIGTISQDGVFHTDGTVGGSVTITVRFGDLTASATVRVRVDRTTRDPSVTDAQVTALDAGGSKDGLFRWLYPYDGTVWPRGLPAPLFQFGGAAADAYKIELSVEGFHYTGYLAAGTEAGKLTLPEEVWRGLVQSADGASSVSVSATKLRGSDVTGPAGLSWRVAPGELKGVIYYNTYKSASTNTGAVMRIKPGNDAEVMLDGCTVCHSVSSQGNVLAAGKGWSNPDPIDSVAFDLRSDGSAPSRYTDAEGRSFPFAALSPDGSVLVSNGVPDGNGPNIRGMVGPLRSRLINSATGAVIDAPSLTDKLRYAMTPAFAPDGTRIAFNDYDRGTGTTIATMTVDLSQSPPAFGALEQAVSVQSGVVAWPSFIPDAKAFLYHEGDRFDTAGYGGTPSYAHIRLASVEGGSRKLLRALNGYSADGAAYLPYGADEEGRRNYEPSVLPVPVGGYYWVLFTSRRAYGNTLAPGGSVPGSDNEWGTLDNNVENPSTRKKLWLAAIDLDYADKEDPSHPAIYLPGQELLAGNMRAYAALEPCRNEGTDCASGADCCSGFCRQLDASDPDAKPVFQCVPPPGSCANVDETCDMTADCCGASAGQTCINHRCATPNITLH